MTEELFRRNQNTKTYLISQPISKRPSTFYVKSITSRGKESLGINKFFRRVKDRDEGLVLSERVVGRRK